MRLDLPAKTPRDGTWRGWLDEIMTNYGLSSGRVGDALGHDASYIRQLRLGFTGIGPQRAHEIGEALHDAGVEWCSGILSVAAEPLYVGWLMATAGWLSECIPATKIRRPWRLIGYLLREPRIIRPFAAPKWLAADYDSEYIPDVYMRLEQDLLNLSVAERAILSECFDRCGSGGCAISHHFPEPLMMAARMAALRPQSDDGRILLSRVAMHTGNWILDVVDDNWAMFGPWAWIEDK